MFSFNLKMWLNSMAQVEDDFARRARSARAKEEGCTASK